MATVIMEGPNDCPEQTTQTGAFGKVDRQMRALVYVWRQFVHDGAIAVSAVTSLEEQLADLYREREQAGGTSYDALRITIEGLNAQLTSLYEDSESSSREFAAVKQTAKNLEEQLIALYQERVHEDYIGRVGADATLVEALKSFEEQLAELYKEREGSRYGLLESNEMVESLEAQVATLLEERNSLAEQLATTQHVLAQQRSKAKELFAAIVEKALV